MLNTLTNLIASKNNEIESWLEKEWEGLTPPFTLSCDIRHSGFKAGVVDANQYPAGFNNLCNSFSRATVDAIQAYLKDYHPAAKKILLFGEEHTRNKFYLKNLQALKLFLEKAGCETKIGLLGELWNTNSLIMDIDGTTLELEKLERKEKQIHCGTFIPDLIISNNDFSNNVPEILKDCLQTIIPSPNMGWWRRTKSEHFDELKEIVENFSRTFAIDPWVLNPLHDVYNNVDLNNDESLKKFAEKIDGVLSLIQKKYNQYEITNTPYVYIKNNSGTYGMGISTVEEGAEVLSLNRRHRNKLLSAKGGASVTSFLIQEGIPTADFYSEHPIEPVIYVVGKKDIGGFFRIHESRNQFESLNAPGMSFSCLCLHKLTEPHEEIFLDCRKKEEVVIVSRFLARLSSLATAREYQKTL